MGLLSFFCDQCTVASGDILTLVPPNLKRRKIKWRNVMKEKNTYVFAITLILSIIGVDLYFRNNSNYSQFST